MATERQLLVEIVDRHPWWYHTMDLGHDVITPGHYGANLLPVASLLGNLDLQGYSCLDIGTMDGKMAFLMEKLGGSVVTVDVFKRDTVIDLVEHFGSTVKYRTGIRDTNLTELREVFGHFDFVLCAGVLYHIFSPIDLVANVRKVIKNNGLAIFESACIRDEKKLYMRLNWGDLYDEVTTIWVPTVACLRRMLQYFGFELIADAILNERVPRYAVLCRAVPRSEFTNLIRDPWLSALLLEQTSGISSEYLKPQLDLDELDGAPKSNLSVGNITSKRRKLSVRRHSLDSPECALLKRGTPCKDF